MKKKLLIVGGLVVLVAVIGVIVLIINMDDVNNSEVVDKPKDYSSINVDFFENMEIDEYRTDDFVVRDVMIRNGFFEGIFESLNNEEITDYYIKVIIYDENEKELDRIEFNILNVQAGEERDLFYGIDKDLSNAYSFKVEV